MPARLSWQHLLLYSGCWLGAPHSPHPPSPEAGGLLHASLSRRDGDPCRRGVRARPCAARVSLWSGGGCSGLLTHVPCAWLSSPLQMGLLDCCKNIGLTLPLALRSPLSCSSSSLSQAWDRFASAVRQNVPGRAEPAIACAGWLSSHPWTRSSIPVSTPSLLIRDTSAEAVLSSRAGQCPLEMCVPVLNRESFPIDVCGLNDRMSKWHKRMDAIHLYLATEKL